MIDVNGIMNALNSPSGRNTAMVGGGAALAGLATGMLAGKSGRKFVGKAAKYGAVAALGGLAFHAINKHRQGAAAPAGQAPAQPAQPAPAAPAAPAPGDYAAAQPGTAYLPADTETERRDRHAKSLLRAMIAAAKADGSVSEIERARISQRLDFAGLDVESRAFIEAEIVSPLNIETVVSGVESVEHAAEIYAASLVAIDADGPIERSYLQLLAARLALDPELVAEIHRSADAGQPATLAPQQTA